MSRSLSFASAVLTSLLLLALAAAAVDTFTITTTRAIVRGKPGITHPILAVVPHGAIFPIIETQEEWHRILLEDGREGWIAHKVGRVEQEAGRPTPVSPAPARGPVAQNRWALVIGNAAYGAEIGPLQNPVNDATDMAVALQQLGFEVVVLLDATRQQMEDGIAAFRRQLRQRGVGLFYFAGHGAQVEGTNYLIPLGANVESAMTAKADALSAEQVLASMVEAGTALNFIILDACRNNPFTPRWPIGRPGLAPMRAARGSLVAYATAPGAVAVDGTGRNGTYTRHLLRYLTAPDLLVEQMFKQVRAAVEEETKGVQTPWESSSLQGDFTLRPTTVARLGAAAGAALPRQE
jgi:hypothetical protein